MAIVTDRGYSTKPFNVRLPLWAIEYINRRSAEHGITKTQVVVDAISTLRAEEMQTLMREGYEEMREMNRRVAEETMAASMEGMPG